MEPGILSLFLGHGLLSRTVSMLINSRLERRKFNTFLFGVALLTGCVSHPQYDEKTAKELFKDAIIPLPANCLLGASNLTERDAIFGSAAVGFVSGTRGAEFIGFKSNESDGTKYYDPPPQFLEDLRAINQRLKPVSASRRLSDAEQDAFWRQPVPVFLICGMNAPSNDQREVFLEIVPVVPVAGRTFYVCRVNKQDGKWTMISKEMQTRSVITH